MKTYRWSEIEHKGSPEEITRAKQEARTEFEAQSYAALQKARESTELELAERLGMPRADVLALEELHLQILGKHLRAQGGELRVRAIFPNTSFDLEPSYDVTPEDAAA